MENLPSNNEVLPIEILGKIFSYMPGGEPKRLLISVCKSWCNAAIYCYGDFAKVIVSEDKLVDLNKDFLKSPLFGSKVDSLTIKQKKVKALVGASISYKDEFTTILESCPNLVNLDLSGLLNIDLYVECMIIPNGVFLQRLQKVVVPRSALNFRVKLMYRTLMVNLRHTLTHLNIMEDIRAFDERGGLVSFVVNECPNLRILSVTLFESWMTPLPEIYLPSLFTRDTVLLEEVCLQNNSGKRQPLLSTKRVNLDTLDLTPNNTLKSLVLATSRMDIGNLKFIMIKFKNLKRLQIYVGDRVTVDFSTTSKSVQDIIRQFHTYCEGIALASVHFHCERTRNRVDIEYNECNQRYFKKPYSSYGAFY